MAHPQSSPRGYFAKARIDVGTNNLTYNSTGVVFGGAIFASGVTGKSITQIVKATGDAKQVLINVKGADFDVEGGFRYARLSVTVGTAASLVSALLLGCYPRSAPAVSAASTVQIV